MGRLKLAAGPLLLAVIITGFNWRLVSRQFTWMDHPDMAFQVLPWFDAEARAFHRGEFPLWDPYVWGGQPMLGQMQPGAAYPLNWILFALPLRNGHINLSYVQLSWVLAHILAAWFCFWLCRDLGCSFTASILGGVGFSIPGILGWLSWPQFVNGAIWTPLVLLFFLRSVRGEARGDRRVADAAVAGAFLGVAFLSGHHQIPTFVALAMAGLWIAELVRSRRRAILPGAAFGLFVALTAGLQLLPAYEYGLRAVRWVGTESPVAWNQPVPYRIHEQYSMLPSGLLALALPNVRVEGAFVGVLLILLALAGLATAWKRWEARALAGLAVGGVALALGSFSVFHGVSYWLLPLVEKARNPTMAIVLTQFAMVVLAAFGLDAIRERAAPVRWIGGLAGLGAVAWLIVAVAVTIRPEAEREYEHWAVLGIVTLALSGLLWLKREGMVGERLLGGLIVLLLLFELGTYVGQNYISREKPAGNLAQLEGHSDVLEFLRKQPDLLRLDVNFETLPANIGDWEGIDTYQAYLASLTSNLMTAEASGVQRKLFALTHYLGRMPLRESQRLLFQGAGGVNVYRDADASPRAWVVHQARQASRAELPDLLRSSELRQETFLLEAAPALEACEGGDEDARLTERSGSRVAMSARLNCRGMVILSDVWFPGWEATVDGAPAKIHEAYGVIRGVVVARGAHTIEMRYRPASAYVGALLTAAGLLGALGLLLRKPSAHAIAASASK